MLWFLKYFRRKIQQKIDVFDSKQSKIMQNFDHNIGFWEKRQFFAENCRKSPKIVIITSTPGAIPTTLEFTTMTSALQKARSFFT
jgi:hypothetical protein